MTENNTKDIAILSQKYTYATVSLILGIACFVNLAGMEKAILAVAFGYMALRATPGPPLANRRMWAKAGVALGSLLLIIVPTIILLNLDRLREIIDVLSRLSSGR